MPVGECNRGITWLRIIEIVESKLRAMNMLVGTTLQQVVMNMLAGGSLQLPCSCST